MITVASMLFWVAALTAHALLQPKILRLLQMRLASPWPLILQTARIVLPFSALGICLMEPMPLALLIWVGTFSIGGLVSGGGLATVMTRRNVRLGLR